MILASQKKNMQLKSLIKRPAIRVTLLLMILLIFTSYMEIRYLQNQSYHNYHPVKNSRIQEFSFSKQKYLINTSYCKIPDIDPFFEEVEKFYHQEKYIPCSEKPLLSYVEQNPDYITLNINQSLIPLYTKARIYCCYSKVRRYVTFEKPDDDIEFSECIPFTKSFVIVDPLVRVSCTDYFSMQIYSNVHAVISPSHIHKAKMYDTVSSSNTSFSVVLVGIDSISKLNLVRTMPKTYNFLEKNDFINLKGYTKVGLNTLPNLIGILAGQTLQQLAESCDYNNNFNDCFIIWDKFKEMDYVTAYAEDAISIGTFNYEKKGFADPPTDFYFRPYMLASEKLKVIERKNMNYCAGPETEGERIMNLAKDFLIALKNYPKFGLFWMNSFSHDDLNMPSAMDEKVEIFLQSVYKHLNNTILIFFSDHGFRFGEIRNTHTGWFEERIPFFYIYVPQNFRKNYPQEYSNLLINSGRLTTAYDIYMTLQNILSLTNENISIEPSAACPKCHSLFKEISEQRTCYDAAIHSDWCVCYMRTYLNPEQVFVQNAANFFVGEVNKLVSSYQQGHKCYKYLLDRVTYSGISQLMNELNQTRTSLLLRIKTIPSATFEGSVDVPKDTNSSFRLVGAISRLDRYAPYSECIESSSLEKYCYCKESMFIKVKKKICKVLLC